MADVFALRLPDGLRDRIKAAAAQNGRSMNTEIIEALERGAEENLIREVVNAILDVHFTAKRMKEKAGG